MLWLPDYMSLIGFSKDEINLEWTLIAAAEALAVVVSALFIDSGQRKCPFPPFMTFQMCLTRFYAVKSEKFGDFTTESCLQVDPVFLVSVGGGLPDRGHVHARESQSPGAWCIYNLLASY